MKKITSFVVLLAALLLTLPAQAFTWNWAEHEALSFLDMKKVTSRFVPINEATPVQMDAMEAPQSMLPVAKVTRRAAIASIDNIVGDYTWDYKTTSTKVADPTTAEATAAQAHVTIAKGTTDGTIVISGMFPNDVKGSVDLSTGLISFEQSALGNFSQGGTDYGSYYFYAQFYNESDSKWYWDSNPVTATVGDDNVITFSNTQWIVRRLKDYSTGTIALSPYYLPSSTLTPSEPLTPVTPSEPAIASAEEFSMTYYSSSTDTEAKSASVKVAVDGNDVYIQGFSSYLPEAWVKGTKDGNTVTFPKMQYMGEYSGYTSFFFYGGDAVFTYDSETSTYSATGQIFGVLGEQYYDGRYFNPVLTKVVEVAGTPATPSINSLKNSNYGWYFTFNIPLQDTNGNNMVASKVTYKIYTDVNHEVSLLTFTPTTHTKLTQDMSEFPYGFTDNYDFTATSIYLNDLFSTTWHQIGIQTIYTGGGETHESEIGWYKIKEYPSAKDIEVTPNPGTDISAAIATALGTEGDWAKNVTITLAEGGNYTITNAIESDGSVIINGNGATIDASGLEDNFIQRKTEPAEWTEANVAITGVTVKGLKKALFYSGVKNYFGDVTIDNCVVEQAADATTFDYTKGSTAVNFTVTNSTFYAPTATTKSFYSSQSGQKTTEYSAEAIETFTFTNNTMYNLATGKNFFTHRQNSQKWLKYVAKGNIFVNCGKSGQVIKGMNGGGSSANPQFDIDGNAFNYEVEGVMTDTSASEETGDAEEPVKNSVAGIVTFPKVAEGKFDGKFRLAEGATAPASLGDPRWALKIIAPVAITPHTPVKAKASDYAEIILTNDLTKKWSDNSWTLTDEAKTWVVYNYDDATDGDIQQTNRANVWFDYASEYEGCDTMIVTSEAKGWGGYYTVTSETNGTSGLLVVGKTRYPEFNITGTEKAKFYFSGSASTAGYAQVEVYEGDATEPVQKKTGDIALTKSTWDKSTLLIVDGLDKEKTYKIVARTVNADGAYEGGDIVLQVVKLYPENLPAKIRPVDIEVSPASGDIAAAVTEAKATVPVVGNITINLTKGTSYTIGSTIEAPAGITINGNGATIDASGLEDNFIQRKTEPAEWTEANVAITGVTVKGLKKALFYSGVKNYFGDVTIDNCVVEQAADATTFDYTKGSTAVNFTVTNSTFYAPTATTKSFYSSQSGQKTTEYSAEAIETFTFTNNTMYNLATGKNFFTHRQNSQKWLKYVAKGNIFVNCGKSGQVIKGMNGGGSSANPQFDIDGNAFNYEVEGVMTDTSASEETGDADEPVKNSVAGVVVFADAANGDFTLGACPAKDASIGDPRWLPAYSQSINIEQLVLDKTTKADIAAALAEKNIEISSNAGLDSLNDEKTLRNEPFLGLKIKAADATVKVLVKKGNALNVKFGCVNDPVNVAINGTPIDTQVAKNTEGSVFTLPAAEADQEVVFTTTAKNTVVLKQIMIGEDIAAVTLPAATKYQVSVAEGIENGTVEFSATSMTDSKGYKTVKVGDEVTITATPAEGYELEAISVTGVTSDIAVEVTDGKFTMPADAVTINATFKVSTGINAVKADALKDAQIYNLQGVRVDKAQKGLYIVNGRKVVIK